MYATGIPKNELARHCTRFLSHGGPRSFADQLRELAQYSEEQGARRDVYGTGDDLAAFEQKVARTLGFESAVFMPSGTMAQQIALRIWADRAGSTRVGFHATAHLEANEELAYRHLHRLEATLLGAPLREIRAADLRDAEAARLSAVLLELPMRRLGGCLPSWQELGELKQAARAIGAKLHLDGARLWECGPYYQRSYADICAGFDSAYVSFYKGLGALAGAMLCGPADFVAEARVWLRRHGGNLYQLTPYWLSAQRGFESRLEGFGARYARALALSRALKNIDGLTLRLELPHTPLLHLWLDADVAALERARDQIAAEDRLWVTGRFFEQSTGCSLLEIAVEDGTMALEDAEIVQALEKLTRLARTP